MMRRTRGRLALCATLLCANLAFIWGNSLMNGEASGALSGWVQDVLGFFLPVSETESGGHLLRKLAHFGEFAGLGALLVWLFSMLGRRGVPRAAFPLLCGFLTACVDETIQIFSPGRSPSPVDVGIDTAGVAAGIVLLLLGYCIYRKTQHIQEETS